MSDELAEDLRSVRADVVALRAEVLELIEMMSDRLLVSPAFEATLVVSQAG